MKTLGGLNTRGVIKEGGVIKNHGLAYNPGCHKNLGVVKIRGVTRAGCGVCVLLAVGSALSEQNCSRTKLATELVSD